MKNKKKHKSNEFAELETNFDFKQFKETKSFNLNLKHSQWNWHRKIKQKFVSNTTWTRARLWCNQVPYYFHSDLTFHVSFRRRWLQSNARTGHFRYSLIISYGLNHISLRFQQCTRCIDDKSMTNRNQTHLLPHCTETQNKLPVKLTTCTRMQNQTTNLWRSLILFVGSACWQWVFGSLFTHECDKLYLSA